MELLKLIKQMEVYEKEGSMNIYEIEKVKDELIKINRIRVEKQLANYADAFIKEMMVRIEKDYQLYRYASEHKEECAVLLKVSLRSVYRKIQNETFNNREKKLIQKAMEND